MSEQPSFFAAFGGPKRFFILLILGVAVVAYIQWDRKQVANAMQAVGAKLGFRISHVGNSWRLNGSIEGIDVSVKTVSENSAGETRRFTEFELSDPFQPRGRMIGTNQYQGLFESLKDYSWQPTGDAEFDKQVSAEGELAILLGKLDAESRTSIAEATAVGWILDEKVWSLRKSGTFTDPAKIESLIDVGITAARALTSTADANQTASDTDFDPEEAPVTLENAEEALEGFLDPRSLEAAIILVNNGSQSDEVRQRLLSAFYQKDRIPEVIVGLGRVGGLLEIAALESVQGEHEELAKTAIDEIKARLEAQR